MPLPSANGWGQDIYSDDENDVDIPPVKVALDPVDRQEQMLINKQKLDDLKEKRKQEAEAEAAARKQQEDEKDRKDLERLQQRFDDKKKLIEVPTVENIS